MNMEHTPEKNGKEGKVMEEKKSYMNAKVKEIVANSKMQATLRTLIEVPEIVVAKKVSKSSSEHHTQKVEAMAGEKIEDAVAIIFTIVDETDENFLDPVKSINRKYRIVDFTLGLQANMAGRNFQGYSAVGFKLMVTKIEEV